MLTLNLLMMDRQCWIDPETFVSPNPIIARWCDDHLSKSPEWNLDYWNYYETEMPVPTVTFATAADMVAFKLRWA